MSLKPLPKFRYGTSQKIDSADIDNGSLLFDYEKETLYIDVKSSRYCVRDIVHVASSSYLPSLANAKNKLYLDESTGDIYYKANGAWVSIQGGSSSAPVLVATTDSEVSALLTASNVGKVILFTGTSTSNYSSGHIYVISKPSTAVITTDLTPLTTTIAWNSVTGKPTTFTPSTHSHAISDVTSLSAELGSKIPTPSGGTNGQFLQKVSGGYSWATAVKTVDTAMSSTSTNPVQNKAVYSAISKKLDAPSSAGTENQFLQKGASGTKWASVTITDGDMKKSVYDTNNDGVVDSAAKATVADSVAWSGVTGKPTTFPASAHTHSMADITSLTNKFASYASTTHSHAISDITGLSTDLGSKITKPSGGSVGWALVKTSDGVEWANVAATVDTALSSTSTNAVQNKVVDSALKSKLDKPTGGTSGQYLKMGANSSISFASVAWSEISGKPSAYPASTHSHAISNVSNLQTTLDSKVTSPSGGTAGQLLAKDTSGFKWVSVDNTLSSTSANPVQNSVVYAALSSVSSAVKSLMPTNTYSATGCNNLDVNGVWSDTGSVISSNPVYTNGHYFAFVVGTTWEIWSGKESYGMPDYYNSTMEGSWSSNGGDTAPTFTLISDSGDSVVQPKLMLTKPASSTAMHLVVQSCSTPTGTYSNVLRTSNVSADRNKVRVFNGSTFVTMPSGGFGSAYNDRVVVVDVEDILTMGCYYRYQWVASGGSINNSGWSAGYYPSANEQINTIASKLTAVESKVNALGITAVSSVATLPASPNSKVLYLIQES